MRLLRQHTIGVQKKLASFSLLAMASLFLFANSADAANTKLNIRVIHAKKGAASMDKRLGVLAKDLKDLPFSNYRLIDSHNKIVSPREKVSFEFPGKNQKRFLVVNPMGARNGKQVFQLNIRELKFQTKVSVPDGGTILVGGPRYDGGTIVFAVTARESVAARRVTPKKKTKARSKTRRR